VSSQLQPIAFVKNIRSDVRVIPTQDADIGAVVYTPIGDDFATQSSSRTLMGFRLNEVIGTFVE
jgi:hypothetical protein